MVSSQDKLQRDQSNAGLNLLKIKDQWRTILRQTRGAELRGEVTLLSQRFEAHVDVLDNIIQVRRSKVSASTHTSSRSLQPWRARLRVTSCLQTLVQELLEAELQSSQVRRGHLQKMEELRTQQETELELLQQLWDTNMEELISSFSRDRSVRLQSAPCWGHRGL